MLNPYGRREPRLHRWQGASGEWYCFSVCRLDEIFDFDGVVYILTRARLDGFYDPLYIGESGDGEERLHPSKHEKMPRARALGLTDVHVHFTGNRSRRLSVETDLRRRHATPLNEQPTPASSTGFAGLGGLFGHDSGIGAGGLNALLALSSPTKSGPPMNALHDFGMGDGIGSLFDNDGLPAWLRALSKQS
jgi:hypothetical protein